MSLITLLATVGFALSSVCSAQDLISCHSDLSKGVIVVMSGGPVEFTNPGIVKTRMDAFADQINGDAYVQQCSNGKGLTSKLLDNQKGNHIHQTKWKKVCEALKSFAPSPVIIVGHSNGGAAAVSLARCLEKQDKAVDLLVTADTVPFGGGVRYLGSSYSVPKNVKININTYTKIGPKFFLFPFPVGHSNKGEGRLGDQIIVNVGFERHQPGGTGHRDSFVDLVGGRIKNQGYSTPLTLFDVTLAVLKSKSRPEVISVLMQRLQELSNAKKFKIKVATSGAQESGEVSHALLTPSP